MLAEIEKRGTMRALADALAEETRSAALAEKSGQLAQGAALQTVRSDGAAILAGAQFRARLEMLRRDAENARLTAERQAQGRAEALGEAQTRASRVGERLVEAERTVTRNRMQAASMAEQASVGRMDTRRASIGTQRAKTFVESSQ